MIQLIIINVEQIKAYEWALSYAVGHLKKLGLVVPQATRNFVPDTTS